MVRLWLRAESRATERRTPIVPADAARLVRDGVELTVEEAPERVFDIEDYRRAGARVAPAGSWVDAPAEAVVVGIKELPETPYPLRHTHVYFGHAFKGQADADRVLDRFSRGGGRLLDLEYLTVAGRRVIAFGYWAGYLGAALGVLALSGQLPAPLTPRTKQEWDRLLAESEAGSALVIGALGRSGRGAVDALRIAGIEPTAWDLAETRELDRAAVIAHELLVNCVVSTAAGEPFVTADDLSRSDRRLRCIADVTCDVTSAANRIPVNTEITTWSDPVRVGSGVAVIAIDNLPSLIPREASEGFSADLTALIPELAGRTGPWAAADAAFEQALAGRGSD